MAFRSPFPLSVAMFQSSPIHPDLIPTLTIFFIFVSFQTNASNCSSKWTCHSHNNFFKFKFVGTTVIKSSISLSIQHLNFTNFAISIYSQKSLKSHRLKIIVRHTILIPLEEQNNLSLFFPAENIQHPIAVISIITKQDSLSTPVLAASSNCFLHTKAPTYHRAIVTFL